MEVIKDFNFEWVPQHSIAVAVTTEGDYEMTRLVLAENQPEYGQHTLIEGYHCSCYGFEDTRWEATIYEADEFKSLMEAWWKRDGDFYYYEKNFAALALVQMHGYYNIEDSDAIYEWIRHKPLEE
jgi:hypothetical protein